MATWNESNSFSYPNKPLYHKIMKLKEICLGSKEDRKQDVPGLMKYLNHPSPIFIFCFISIVILDLPYLNYILSPCVSLDPGLVHHPVGKNKRLPLLCFPFLVLGLVCCLFARASQSEDPARHR